MTDAMVLATALVGYRGMKLEEIVQFLKESIVVEVDGRQVIELTIFEKKIGLPDNFFANAIKEGAPTAATAEASETINGYSTN